MPEYINCILCKEKCDLVILDRVTRYLNLYPPYKVVKCRNCGLTFLNPRLTANEVAKTYNRDYFVSCKGDSLASDNPKHRDRMRRIEEYKDEGRILDIGAATGGFLKVAERRGWEVYGVEISDWACKQAKRIYDLNILQGAIEEHEFPENFFDVVHLNQVLEHLPHPMETLRKISTILKPDGLLVLEVPNQNSLSGLVYWYLQSVFDQFLRVPSEPALEHFYFFDPISLNRLLRETHFRVVRERTYHCHFLRRQVTYKFGLLIGISLCFIGSIFRRGPLIEIYAKVTK